MIGYEVEFETEDGKHRAHVCADVHPTDPRTIEAIESLAAAAYNLLKDKDPQDDRT